MRREGTGIKINGGIRSIQKEAVMELALQNVRDLESIIKWNEPSLITAISKPMIKNITPRLRDLPFPRLGYACLNTYLRKQKPTIFCSRTCRIATIQKEGLESVMELALQNVRDLESIIKWNEANNIRFFRVSSDLFPFASHLEYGYDLDYAKDELARIGTLARSLGHRLTSHPSQFNQLGSPSGKVVESTARDLNYHAQIFNYMGMDKDSVMVLHAGGVFGDKTATLERWGNEYVKLPPTVRDRIVLENDDVSYTVRDILPLCQRLHIPLVLDWHHHDILNEFCTGDRPAPSTPSSSAEGAASDQTAEKQQQTSLDDPELPQLLEAIKETWTRRGIRQKQHYSESRAGAFTAYERKGHSDRVRSIPVQCDDTVDLMLEAKDKEQAVFDVYTAYGMSDVHPDHSWIAGVETKRVVDRNRKPKKAEEEDLENVDGSPPRRRKTHKTQSVKSAKQVVEEEVIKKDVIKKGKKRDTNAANATSTEVKVPDVLLFETAPDGAVQRKTRARRKA